MEIFDKENSLNKLEKFTSINGPKYYNLKINTEKIILAKSEKPIEFKKSIKFLNEEIVIFEPDFPIYWEVKN